ncbi:peptidase M61 [Flavobacterium zepuense]|uniref:Peptidase M61 n=1 Tax=Flavobacterium zepuense TaxID=2593302 RepID=A0A552V2I4_9FLAO|nr:peptidase M61 [Flavobacterium zepuense]TRW24675.1 peptidase M61 [Flavobacterium zepuense]
MKRFICTLAMALTMGGFAYAQKGKEVKVAIDLKDIKDDKVLVTVIPQPLDTETTTYYVPKIIPGTYSEDNYGKWIEGFKAFDKKGKELTVVKGDDNSWKISGAKKLAKVTYLVNDTFDNETQQEDAIFSPSGTNILAGENILLNTHGFVGYFEGKGELPYEVTITHPATLWGATSMVDTNASNEVDVFTTSRYPELVDHPIMYSKPDYTTFKVDDMDIIISVYSPTGKVKAADITPAMEKMMRAQKKFLGPINSTKKYSVLIYLSSAGKEDAQGFGALEHTTSTTVVLPEQMPEEQLNETLKDVVSHEFFHIVTPLSVHSKEIQFFNYNTPKMSEHLWMYEGVTEYFANLFQIQQGLIDEDAFLGRIADKIAQAKRFDDTMPFTKMSKNVLEQPYKDAYVNVYQKGALIAMCLDIQLRESSNGQKGILALMRDLSKEYGNNKPFNDEDLFGKITTLTNPTVGEFLKTYVAGNTPIPYDTYFAKMGVTKTTVKKPGNPFIKGEQEPYIGVNQTKEIFLRSDIEPNEFFSTLGVKKGDIILAVNDTNYNLDNIYDMIMSSTNWKDGETISMKVKRDGKEVVLKGKVKMPVDDVEGYHATDASKAKLREAWLKGN